MLLQADWVLPIRQAPIRQGAVGVEAGRITEVGPAEDLRARLRGEPVREFPGCALLPGLINAHTHLEYSVFRGFAHPCGFGEWMMRLLLARRSLTPDDFAVSAEWGARECIRSGVTCIADASVEGWTTARAAAAVGLRARVYLEVFGLDDSELSGTMAHLQGRLASLRRECGPLVQAGISPHAPYTVSARLYREVALLAQREGLKVATHVAESAAETEFLETGAGPVARAYQAARLWKGEGWSPPKRSTVAYLESCDALNPDVLAVHCVQVGDRDIATLTRHGVKVCHCPRSNQHLGCGSAPIVGLLGAGVPVALGTDSLGSNDSLDMFEEMWGAMVTSRRRALQSGERRLAAAEVLHMATLGGARALGLDRVIGSIEPGKRADLLIVQLPPRRGSAGGAGLGGDLGAVYGEHDARGPAAGTAAGPTGGRPAGVPSGVSPPAAAGSPLRRPTSSHVDPVSCLVSETSAKDVRLVMIEGKVVLESGNVRPGRPPAQGAVLARSEKPGDVCVGDREDDLSRAFAAVRAKLGLPGTS